MADAHQGDYVLDDATNAVTWYHRNGSSCWPITMKVQGLEGLIQSSYDPLLHRAFGGTIEEQAANHSLDKDQIFVVRSEFGDLSRIDHDRGVKRDDQLAGIVHRHRIDGGGDARLADG